MKFGADLAFHRDVLSDPKGLSRGRRLMVKLGGFSGFSVRGGYRSKFEFCLNEG